MEGGCFRVSVNYGGECWAAWRGSRRVWVRRFPWRESVTNSHLAYELVRSIHVK